MPRVTVKTNMYLNKERKYRIMVDMKKVIEKIPCEDGGLLMADFQDECFMLFGEEASAPCASIEVSVINEVYDYYDRELFEEVLVGMSKAVMDQTGIPENRVFAYFKNAPIWTCLGKDILKGLVKIE